MTDVPSTNGTSIGANAPAFDTANILQALELIHNPSTKNDVRRQASEFLENLKGSNEAPQYGFNLSTDRSQPPLVRHFGLSLLSHVIHHEAHHLSEEQNAQLRDCVLDLGRSITSSDLPFIRNKIAELWIELAKRSWALDWFNLDEQLVHLWSQDLVHKDFVLTILENLSEDVFVRDDNIAILRGRDLNTALVEVFTSSSTFAGGIKVGDRVHHVRFGDEGWLARIKIFLDDCLKSSVSSPVKDTALRGLATLRTAFVWVMTPAVVHSMTLAVTCNFLTQSDPDVVLAAVDVLLSLYGRTRLEELEVQALVHPLTQPDSISTFRHLYSWSIVSVEDIDSSKYVISKKLSELMSLLSDHVCQYAPPDGGNFDVGPFLQFLIAVAEHQSLIVSIPVVHSWVKILEVPLWRKIPAVLQCIGPLLQLVSQRLIQYDQLPEDTLEPAVIFVNEEIELFPERQGFYANYRRLCSAVLEWICYAQLEEAMEAVLRRADVLLDEIHADEDHFDPETYERVSMTSLRADAYFAMVDAAFKGLDRWQAMHQENPTPEEEQLARRVRESSKAWMLNLMSQRDFKDPQIRQRQIRTAVEVSNRALQKDTGFAFNVLEHILSSFIINHHPHQQVYSEAVAELHGYATSELRRLSLQHADYFVTFYDQLQGKFTDLINQLGADERLQIDLKSTLFSVIQRATTVGYAERQAKLQEFLSPLAASWADESLQAMLQSFESFAHSQAFDQIAPYMASIGAGNVEDWSQAFYDDRGAMIQQDMLAGYAKLPLRESRILLSISTDRLDEGSPLQKMVCELWSPLMPSMLSHVFRLTRYNHQLHNPASWPNTSPDMDPVIRRILRDRYWQSGISSGSMNQFHSQVKSTKSTLEGFASSVRGRIRNNLEQCYSIIHTLGRLGSAFYGLQQVAEMIAEAALDSASPLSPHHFAVLIQMLPKLIDECPPELRQSFLTPILSSLLQQMDTKLSNDWVKMTEIKQTKHDEENLNDEMRDDSVLRQTTYKAVNLVAHWINPKREEQLSTKKSIVNGNHLTQGTQQTMREFILSNLHVLDRLIVFITHALAFRDTRSCTTMLGAAQRLVLSFASDHFLSGQEAAAVREFISTDMLKTAITCLNDGYFADQQKEYAHLIAMIWLSYGLPAHVPATESAPAHDRPALTATPRSVILSLPGMTEAKVDKAAAQLLQEGASGARSKKLRAVILSLLEGVRGVRLSELGKIDMRQQQSKILEKYKQRELLGMQGMEGQSGGSGAQDDGVDLGGVADMFAG
ncbi:armadillo-type protein [Exophiala viscosa]|uniref:armadillo-type protein n=1 Tax=Exophiala viscosa TaxID=2486360 RepID=UPI002191FCFC|nr:armadillo-type protein [Exophiala viscosa]